MVDHDRQVALLGSEWGDPDDPKGDRQGFRADAKLLRSGVMDRIVIPWTFPISPEIQEQLRSQGKFQVLVTKDRHIRFIFTCEDFATTSLPPPEWAKYVLEKYNTSTILGGKRVGVQLLVASIEPYGGEGLPLTGWNLWKSPGAIVRGALLGGWQYVYQES